LVSVLLFPINNLKAWYFKNLEAVIKGHLLSLDMAMIKFKHSINMTPYQFIIKKMLERSKELLKSPSL
jgi:hypothetical protein